MMTFGTEELRQLLQLLDEHPEWRSSLRRALMGEEAPDLAEAVRGLTEAQERTEGALASLTQRVDALAQAQTRTEAALGSLTERVDTLAEAQARTEERLEALTARVDALTERVDALAQAQARTEERLERLTERVDALAQAQARTEERLERLTERVDALAEAQRRTEERLEALTARVDALTERVDALAQAQARTEERLDRLAERMDALAGHMSKLAEELHGLAEWQRGEAGRREGERYERDIIRRAPFLFGGGDGGATDDRAVRERLAGWLAAFARQNGGLTSDEDPTLADLLWWKGDRVLVVEVSIQVNGHDIDRAVRRAGTLQSAGVEAAPVVVGDSWTSARTESDAQVRGVLSKVGDRFSEDLIAFRRLSD